MATHDLTGMFTDNRFRRITSRKYFGTIGDEKVGVVLATRSPNFDSVALNKAEFDDVLNGKKAGRLDVAYIVAAKVNGVEPMFIGVIEAEELRVKLADEEPRSGRFGPFYVLSGNIFPALVDEPF